jgi:hypothetical protein
MGPYEGGNTFYHNDLENNYIHVEGGDFALITNLWDNITVSTFTIAFFIPRPEATA